MDAQTLEALAAAMQTPLADDTPKDNLTDTVSSLAEQMVNGRKQLYTAAQNVQEREDKQFVNNLKNFFASQDGAIAHGNTNACNVNHVHQANHKAVSIATNKSTRVIELPDTAKGKLYNTTPKKSQNRVRAPKPMSHPRSGGNPRGAGNSQYNQLIAPMVVPQTRISRTVEPLPPNGAKHYAKFAEATLGRRDRSATDGAILFTRHGTPMYGSQITQQAEQKNVSANLATEQAATLGIPKSVTVGKAVAAQSTAVNEVQGTSNTGQRVATGLAVVAIATAVIAVLWVCEGLVVLIAFVTQIGFIATQVSNITQLVKMAWEGGTKILGLEKVAKETGDFFENNLSKLFGSKENYLRTKFMFMRVSNVVTTATNSLASLQSASQILADAIAENSNNTSRMGNMWRSVGMFGNKVAHFNERVQLTVTGRFAGLQAAGQKLGVTASVSAEMVQVIDAVKTAGETEQQIQESEKQELEKNEKKIKEDKEKIEGDTNKKAPDIKRADI
jgi:hypothetical protein